MELWIGKLSRYRLHAQWVSSLVSRLNDCFYLRSLRQRLDADTLFRARDLYVVLYRKQ